MDQHDLITDDEIDKIDKLHDSPRFCNSFSSRDEVMFGVLKCASGYYQNKMTISILYHHGLIDSDYNLTIKGQQFLWAAFSNGMNHY